MSWNKEKSVNVFFHEIGPEMYSVLTEVCLHKNIKCVI